MRIVMLVSVATLFGSLTTPGAVRAAVSGGDQVLCAVGQPCIDSANSTATSVSVHWKSDDSYGHFNLRWSRPGRVETQVERDGGTEGSYTVNNAHAGATYTFKVQGCTKPLVGSSHCSPWEEQSVVAGLTSGSDTCRPGFVWRDAFTHDHVCVVPGTRDQAAGDNGQAAVRRQPGAGDTCRSGFVWREANPRDHVCVTPEVRTQTAVDNRLGPGRRVQR